VTDRVTLHDNVVLDRGGRGAVQVQGEQLSLIALFGSQALLVMRKGLKDKLLKRVLSLWRPTIQGHGYTRNGVLGTRQLHCHIL